MIQRVRPDVVFPLTSADLQGVYGVCIYSLVGYHENVLTNLRGVLTLSQYPRYYWPTSWRVKCATHNA